MAYDFTIEQVLDAIKGSFGIMSGDCEARAGDARGKTGKGVAGG